MRWVSAVTRGNLAARASVLTDRMPLSGEYLPSPRPGVRNQVQGFERSDGAKQNTIQGRLIVVVTMRGASSGSVRKVPLMRVEHEGAYALVASLGGGPRNPLWYANLVAHPEVELQDGAVRQDMVAREVHGDERALWWERAVEAFPPYAGYQRKTDRLIPVFVLAPLG